jgi:hypothetical protein
MQYPQNIINDNFAFVGSCCPPLPKTLIFQTKPRKKPQKRPEIVSLPKTETVPPLRLVGQGKSRQNNGQK